MGRVYETQLFFLQVKSLYTRAEPVKSALSRIKLFLIVVFAVVIYFSGKRTTNENSLRTCTVR
jgi:hypothetical protein